MHGNKGRKFTEEHKRKIGIANKGKKNPHTDEWRKKVSEIHKKSGLTPPSWKGKKRSKESVEKSALKRRGQKRPTTTGKNNNLWKGGISKDINKYMMNRHRINNEKKAGRKTPEQCEICGCFGKESKRGLCFDHCHKTGKFRGWLCMRCNTALGLVRENTETLNALIEYIKKHRIKSINGLE